MQTHKYHQVNAVRRLVLVSVASALAITTNFLLLPLENVKLMDFIVFVVGFLAGPVAGVSTGILTWSVYGPLNPNGFSLPVWLATMLGETLYGIVGGVIGQRFPVLRSSSPSLKFNALLGLIAFGLTFAYDFITTLVHAWVFGVPFGSGAFGVYLVLSAPFFVAHEASNLLLFALVAVPVMRPLNAVFVRVR